jgi:predicted permease
MLASIVQALLPVAFVVFLGWLAAALKALKREHAGILATLVTDFALPCSLTGAIPSATAVSMSAVKYGVYTERTSATTLISALLSVITIGLTIALVCG